ncbi:FAS1 domain-containing protein [Chytridium lagenaria]|nr:FAS1 domain-containing protein [Chytridium lagenaria]
MEPTEKDDNVMDRWTPESRTHLRINGGYPQQVDPPLISSFAAIATSPLLHRIGPDLLEVLSDPDFSSLVGAATSAGLSTPLTALRAPSPSSPPTTLPFAALKADTSDKALLTAVLSYHVVAGVTYAPKEAGKTILDTFYTPEGLSAQKVVANTDLTKTTISYRLSTANVLKSVPSLTTPPLDIATVAGEAGLKSLVDTIVSVDLLKTVQGLKDVTIFAPNDKAFAAIESVTKTLSKEAITSVLLLHVTIPDVKTSLEGQTLSAAFTGSAVTVAGKGNTTPANVVTADVVFNAGVVHVIDTVLLPGAASTTAPTTPTTTAAPKGTNIAISGATSVAPAGVAAAAVAVAAMFL